MNAHKIFISYSHDDRDNLELLEKYLSPIFSVSPWSDNKLELGDNWQSEIRKAMDSCSIAILLVSHNFLSSAFIMSVEVPHLMDLKKKRDLTIIPIILSPCLWTENPQIASLNLWPKDGKTLSDGSEIDKLGSLTGFVRMLKEKINTIPSPDPSTNPYEDKYKKIIEGFNKNNVILFLGPGILNFKGDIRTPNFNDLRKHLISNLEDRDESDPLTLASQKIHTFEGQKKVYHYIEKAFPKNHFSPGHNLLASLNCPLIISTTFDTFLEEAYAERKQKFVVVSHILSEESEDKGKMIVRYSHKQKPEKEKTLPRDLKIKSDKLPIIYKLHGSLPLSDPDGDFDEEESNSIVISEENYFSMTRIFDNANTAIPSLFLRKLMNGIILFLGFDINNWNSRLMINILEKLQFFESRKTYAVSDDFSQFRREFWKKRGVETIQEECFPFLNKIRRDIKNKNG